MFTEDDSGRASSMGHPSCSLPVGVRRDGSPNDVPDAVPSPQPGPRSTTSARIGNQGHPPSPRLKTTAPTASGLRNRSTGRTERRLSTLVSAVKPPVEEARSTRRPGHSAVRGATSELEGHPRVIEVPVGTPRPLSIASVSSTRRGDASAPNGYAFPVPPSMPARVIDLSLAPPGASMPDRAWLPALMGRRSGGAVARRGCRRLKPLCTPEDAPPSKLVAGGNLD
jgi:hypothetical protein